MVYTESDILMESSFVADITRITTAGTMMCETYEGYMYEAEETNDLDTFLEASEKQGNGLLSMIGSIFSRIRKFISDTIAKINERMRKKNLEKIFSPETKRLVKELNKGKKVESPDIAKVTKMLKQSEEYAEKFANKAASYIKSIKPGKNPEKQMKKVNAFIESGMSEYNKLAEKIDAELKGKKPLTVEMIYDLAKMGIDYCGELDNMNSRMDKIERIFKDACDDVRSTVFECVEFYDADGETLTESDLEYLLSDDDIFEEAMGRGKSAATVQTQVSSGSTGFFAKLKNLISKATSAISSFVQKHTKLVIALSTVVISVLALIGVNKLSGKFATKQAAKANASRSVVHDPDEGGDVHYRAADYDKKQAAAAVNAAIGKVLNAPKSTAGEVVQKLHQPPKPNPKAKGKQTRFDARLESDKQLSRVELNKLKGLL